MPQSARSPRAPSRDATQPTENAAQTPVEKFRDGPVHASIWQNQGAKGAFRVASFELRYRDGQGQWQSGHSYTSSALLHLESAAREAHARIKRWRQANRPNQSPRPSH
jgi:hypothetical protein